MDFRLVRLVALCVGMLGSVAVTAAECKLKGLAQLPVTMRGMKPVIAAKINGSDVKFLVDSGAFYSIISTAAAEGLNLPKTLAPGNFYVRGVGGTQQVMVTTVKEFGLAGAVVNNMEFLVTGGAIGGDIVGALGQNVFSFADAEFDLGNGGVRLFQAENCKDAEKVYWLKPGEKFSSVAIQPVTKFESHIVGTAYVNGKKVRVMFDTGFSQSTLSMKMAERLGIKPNSPGVVQGGRLRGGGSGTSQVWIAPIASFKIGDEEIKDTKIRFSDTELTDFDLILGADFFLSHRIYVAYGANRVLFTYRGGSVFDLGAGNDAPMGVADNQNVGEPVDAQGFSRRGGMFAARRDYPRAIADLSRAIELAPTEADYYYQRARHYADSRQAQQALSDVDQAISLKTDHQGARMLRASLRQSRLEATGQGRTADIVADIDVARSTTAKEDDVHYDLGRLYASTGTQDKAMAEFDQWLALHRDDGRVADARAYACRARTLLNVDLGRALDDCNSAVRDRSGQVFPLESRGLLHVRMRNWDKAITDLDKVVAEQPRNAWALYARGLAKVGKGAKAEGDADIAAARAANPRTVQNAQTRGFVP